MALKIEHNPEEFRIVDADARTIDEQPEREQEARESLDPSNRTTDEKKVDEEASARDDGSLRSALVDEKMEIPANAAEHR